MLAVVQLMQWLVILDHVELEKNVPFFFIDVVGRWNTSVHVVLKNDRL